MHHYPLLQLLADGNLHSGTELAGILGVSRTAVWKQLQHLENLGLDVETVRGHGYRLRTPLDLLRRDSIVACLPSAVASQVALDVREAVDSTNQCLMAQQQLLNHYHACIAEQQLNGRGRRGRVWNSPFARNLYLSLACETDGTTEAIQGVTLTAGVAVAEALEALGVGGVELKWPNDVWLNGQKVAGILTELQGTVQERFRLVIGVGLNVYMSDSEVVIDQPWTSLARERQVPAGGRNRIAGEIIDRLVSRLEKQESIASEGFRRAWDRRDALSGKTVTVKGKALVGVAQGIDAAGQLRLLTESGAEETLNAGEVSIKVASHDTSD